MPPRTRQPCAAHAQRLAKAQRLAEVHLVDRYDRAQLTALDRVDQLDRAATPLVVPFHTSRVYRTEPTSRPRRATIAGPEFRVTRDTVLTLLNLGLIYCADVVRIDAGPDRDRPDEQRSAYLLTATRHGRDVLDIARRIRRLPR